MERGVRWALLFVVALFAILTVWTSFWSVLAGPGLAVHPRNARLRQINNEIVRGGIYARDDTPIALSSTAGVRQFVGSATFAHTVGYSNRRYGQSGLERAYNKELLGLVDETALARLWARLNGDVWVGWDVVTTLDNKLQEAAVRAMGDRVGAVVAIDPRDGAVLAMLSTPGFHPERVEEALATSDAGLNPLFNRAALGQYPPGSAFKPLVLAAALESGAVRPDEVYDDEGSTLIGGRRIENANGVAHGSLALDDALAVSSNTVFGQMAVDVGAAELTEFARSVGLGDRLRFPIPTAPGNLPENHLLEDKAALAALGIGQGALLVTPLQMAVAVSAIANGGWRTTPYIVSHMRRPDRSLRQVAIAPGVRALSPGTAHFVREAMIEVVERGTGTAAGVEGLVVAGKTGTAEVGDSRSHAWFVGFAPARAPQVAVVVVVEHGGYGGTVAAPIARAILSQALSK